MNTEVIRNSLLGLGSTANEIANSLRNLGIRGTKGDGFHCPIHNYLATVYPTPIHVSHTGIHEYPVERKPCTFGFMGLPLHVVAFLINFDNGEYPDLVEVSDDAAV